MFVQATVGFDQANNVLGGLSFSHCMAQVEIVLIESSQASLNQIDNISLNGLVLEGTFNTADGIATADDGGQPSYLCFTPQNMTKTESKASIVLTVFPQSIGSLLLDIKTVDGKNHQVPLNVQDSALRAGTRHTFTITLT